MGDGNADTADTGADAQDAGHGDLVSQLEMDMNDLGNLAAPQPMYRSAIEQGGVACPMEGVTVTFSRELTDHVLRHHELFSSDGGLDLGNIRPLIPLNVDPPQHGKYRRILDPLFAPKRMDEQDADITARANHFIDAFIDRGECHFTEEFAELFPSAVFLGLMGLPWSELDTFIHLRDGILRPHKTDPNAMFEMDARQAVMRATGLEIYDYFGAQLDDRAARPTDDILTHFLTAEIDGECLTRDEILDICFLFLIAGLDTVSDSLTCFYAFLARNPGHRQRIVDDPSVIPNAVEELLRWESPVPGGVPRIATQDTTLPNGIAISKGDAVMVSYGAANIDPVEFPDGFDVRFDRDVNRHIAFGGGVHRCLGSHLARRELRITLREWHRRIPSYRIKPGHEALDYAPGLRHVSNLVLAW
ncbi:MAG TPA: cytochrome P450 [Acidimicrobiia bacterium]